MAEFLAKFPAEPYLRSCERLGDDVAAVQLETVQLEEAQRSGELREAAMDSLVRDLNYYLPSGWPEVAKGNFELASAYADWFVRLKQANQELETVADAVRNSLTDLCPPAGWKPSSPSDPFIKAAFARGWPLDR